MKTFKGFIKEGSVKFEDHDADDSDFKALLKKHGLKAKTKGDVTTVTGPDAKIQKMLKTMRMEKDEEGYAVLEALQSEGSKEEYQKFFDKKLKKYGVDSPDDLSDEEKKKFYDEVDKEWKADHEEKKEALVKEYIKKDGARRRCAGGDGRRTKKTKEEDCDDMEHEDDEEMEESSINEKFEIERDARKYKKGDKVEVALVGKRRKEVWVPGVVDGFEMKPGNRKYLEITYTKTMEMRKGEIIRKGIDGALIDPEYGQVTREA